MYIDTGARRERAKRAHSLYYTTFIGADMDLPRYRRPISSSAPDVQNEQLRVHESVARER